MIERQEIMWAELKADCYAGENCDEVEPRWKCFADGDKQAETLNNKEPITLSAEHLPIGATVVVSVPVCHSCGFSSGVCNCGFDWEKWVLEQYS